MKQIVTWLVGVFSIGSLTTFGMSTRLPGAMGSNSSPFQPDKDPPQVAVAGLLRAAREFLSDGEVDSAEMCLKKAEKRFSVLQSHADIHEELFTQYKSLKQQIADRK